MAVNQRRKLSRSVKVLSSAESGIPSLSESSETEVFAEVLLERNAPTADFSALVTGLEGSVGPRVIRRANGKRPTSTNDDRNRSVIRFCLINVIITLRT